ncbi:MAG TPA: hypothetical protein VHC69_02160 [Polyangiaceae bacterium]|nr:hypothetical protein [Polyangiaceae bacterium]
MSIAVPEGTQLYFFGSVTSSPSPNDLDVLVVYDAGCIPPCSIYDALEPAFSDLRRLFGLRVHPTVLTENEAAETDFIARFGCVKAEAGGLDV